MPLGDLIHAGLSRLGLTPQRVSGWLGEECQCKERQKKLNALDRWARRVLSGKGTEEELNQLTDPEI